MPGRQIQFLNPGGCGNLMTTPLSTTHVLAKPPLAMFTSKVHGAGSGNSRATFLSQAMNAAAAGRTGPLGVTI